MAFTPGWTPDDSARTRARMARLGQSFNSLRGDAFAAPILPASSLSGRRLRHLEQGQAGTCWAHAGTQLAEVFASANGYAAFPICRRLVGWQGKQLEGGGNPSNGGDPTDAILAMTSRGAGIAHESLCPYTDDYRTLGTRPPDAVLADARAAHLAAPIEVGSDDEARALIASNCPVANGIWWPFQWDRRGSTLIDWIGPGTYGHALLEIGYVKAGTWPGDAGRSDWFQLDNWHGLLYRPLPPELAALVPGYAPVTASATSDFWIRADVYATVRGYGNAIRASATDLAGLATLCTAPDQLAWPT